MGQCGSGTLVISLSQQVYCVKSFVPMPKKSTSFKNVVRPHDVAGGLTTYPPPYILFI